MHPCRECGKTVDATAQFCPWCFALPGTADEGRWRPEPVTAGVAVGAPAERAVARVPQPTSAAPQSSPPWTAATVPPPSLPAPPTPVWGGGQAPSRWSRALLVGGLAAVVAALVVGGLAVRKDGGGDRPGASAPTPAVVPAVDVEKAGAVVDRAVLKLEDLGPGWASDGEGTTARTRDGDREMAECLGIPYVEPVAAATSPTFVRGDAMSSGIVEHWATAEAAASTMSAFESPRFGGCLAQELRRGFENGTPFPGSGRLTTEPALPLPGVPDAKRFRGRLGITMDGVGRGELWLDTAMVVRGSASVYYAAIRPNAPTDDVVAARAVQAMVGRL